MGRSGGEFSVWGLPGVMLSAIADKLCGQPQLHGNLPNQMRLADQEEGSKGLRVHPIEARLGLAQLT